MNSTQQTARVGLFFLLGLALIWVTFETLSGGKFFKDKGYSLVAGFDTLKELKVGDEVRMAGVKVGTVQEVRLGRRRAEAILRLEPHTVIGEDAIGSIVMAGLIGTNYVGIELGSIGARPLKDGEELRTKTTPDLNAIMAQIGNLGTKLEGALGTLSGALTGDGKPGGGIIQKLDKLVSDNSDGVGATITNLKEVTAKLNSGEGTLGRLLNDPKMHDELVAAVTEIKTTAAQAKGFVASAQAIVDQVKSGKGTLGALVFDDTAGNDLRLTVKNLRDVSDKIARGEGTLGKLLADDTLYRDLQGVLRKADSAIDGLGDSGPITAVGVLAKPLF